MCTGGGNTQTTLANTRHAEAETRRRACLSLGKKHRFLPGRQTRAAKFFRTQNPCQGIIAGRHSQGITARLRATIAREPTGKSGSRVHDQPQGEARAALLLAELCRHLETLTETSLDTYRRLCRHRLPNYGVDLIGSSRHERGFGLSALATTHGKPPPQQKI